MRRRVGVALLLVWTAALIVWMRGHLLDDAFIHLRYAEQFLARGFLTYDGVTPSQGTSSLLYVAALVAVSRLDHWAFWPKVLSVAGYAALGALVWAGTRRRPAWALPLGVVLAGPMAIRVLTDGMETSWAAVAAVLLAGVAARRSDPRGRGALLAISLLGAATVWLRVDLLVPVAAIVVAERLRGAAGRRTGLALAAGAAAALVSVLAAGAHLLPDGAVAKNAGWAAGPALLTLMVRAHLGSLSLGMGLFVLWLASWRRLHAAARDEVALRRAAWVVNLAGPLFWTAAVLSGQVTHGVRYFVPHYLFAIGWNVLSSPRLGEPEAEATWLVRKGAGGWRGPLLLAALWTLEVALLRPVVRSRTETLHALRSAGLERFAGQPAVAADIGQIGYFSGAAICDLRGLVNGRAFAQLSYGERARACWARQPAFAFLVERSPVLANEVAGWPVCGRFGFGNVGDTDLHTLRVRPALAAGCAGAGTP